MFKSGFIKQEMKLDIAVNVLWLWHMKNRQYQWKSLALQHKFGELILAYALKLQENIFIKGNLKW